MWTKDGKLDDSFFQYGSYNHKNLLLRGYIFVLYTSSIWKGYGSPIDNPKSRELKTFWPISILAKHFITESSIMHPHLSQSIIFCNLFAFFVHECYSFLSVCLLVLYTLVPFSGKKITNASYGMRVRVTTKFCSWKAGASPRHLLYGKIQTKTYPIGASSFLLWSCHINIHIYIYIYI